MGSPDNNDYAEIVLAKIYGKKPFAIKPTIRDGRGFIFYKDYLDPDLKSSFYSKCKTGRNSVKFSDHNIKISGPNTYGILTIARNPYAERKGVVIVLSGFTGIATWGLMRLLIDVSSENDGDVYKEEGLLRSIELNLHEMLKKFDPDLKCPFTVLVKFEFEFIENIEGDNRKLKDVTVYK